jgi:hypothetical protein
MPVFGDVILPYSHGKDDEDGRPVQYVFCDQQYFIGNELSRNVAKTLTKWRIQSLVTDTLLVVTEY